MQAVAHVHSKGYIHGAISPLNIVCTNDGGVAFIDLSASAKIGAEAALTKASSAYIPPEAVHVNARKSVAVVRSASTRDRSGFDYDLLLAHPSFDVWALGCVFYQLCSGIALFHELQCENLSTNIEDMDNLFELAEWNDNVKAKKMSKISNVQARDLVSRMLMKAPSQRLSIERVSSHPFLTASLSVQMEGEGTELDVVPQPCNIGGSFAESEHMMNAGVRPIEGVNRLGTEEEASSLEALKKKIAEKDEEIAKIKALLHTNQQPTPETDRTVARGKFPCSTVRSYFEHHSFHLMC